MFSANLSKNYTSNATEKIRQVTYSNINKYEAENVLCKASRMNIKTLNHLV